MAILSSLVSDIDQRAVPYISDDVFPFVVCALICHRVPTFRSPRAPVY